MEKIVYILSLSYSGSTILDLLLGLHPRIFGFGEINLIFKEKINLKKRYCSCGEKGDNCPFWKDFHFDVSKNSHREFYEKFVDYFYSRKEKKDIILDSSKKLSNFKKVKSYFPKANIKVIFLIRDVRGFSFSMYNHRIKNKFMIPLYQIGWWCKNKNYKKFLEDKNIDYIQISYENLCFYPINTLKKICSFLELDFSNDFFKNLNESESHIISGNSVRGDRKRKNKINYDFRWFRDLLVNLSYIFLPFVAHWNNKNVYKDID